MTKERLRGLTFTGHIKSLRDKGKKEAVENYHHSHLEGSRRIKHIWSDFWRYASTASRKSMNNIIYLWKESQDVVLLTMFDFKVQKS